MKITTLLENKSSIQSLKSSHGLSLYIEHLGQKILFDLGPNKDFFKNAKTLGIDLKEVDMLVISHGHYDHATELDFFMKYNEKAKVYISKSAFDTHVGKVGIIVKDVGIKKVSDMNRLQYVDGTIQITESIIITSEVQYKEEVLSDERLFVKRDKQYFKDTFDHEIYMILKENEKSVLITGCSHKGIHNIVEELESKFKLTFDYVIGGFHLKRFKKSNDEHVEYLNKLGTDLNLKKTNFFACHCTGDDAYNHLNKFMANLNPLHTGDEIKI